MIIISNALPKSASTALFYYTQDLINAAFSMNGNDEFLRRCANGIMEGVGGYLYNLDDKNTKELRDIVARFGPFVAKAHFGAHPNLIRLINDEIAKMTVIHRDPRDVVISSVDCCKRTAETNYPIFKGHNSLDVSIPPVKKWVTKVIECLNYGHCHEMRYAELVSNPCDTLTKMTKFLGIKVNQETIKSIVRDREKNRNPLYNSGKVLRFRSELDQEQIDMLTSGLHDEILALGYQL